MPVEHACRTCQHFAPEPLEHRPNLGVCTHPDHASDGVPILIYQQETRCRRGFGEDDWAPAGIGRSPSSNSHARDADIVIDERPAPMRRRHAFPFLAPIPIYLELEDALAD